jgi:hypothetical protein
MFRFLMGYENLQIIKVTLAVVAPWPGEDFFDIGILPLALTHVADRSWMIEIERNKIFKQQSVALQRS